MEVHGESALTALVDLVLHNLYIFGGLQRWRPNALFAYAPAMVAGIAIDSVSKNCMKVNMSGFHILKKV